MKTVAVRFPDMDVDNFYQAFYKSLMDTQDSIIKEIKKLAEDDDFEFLRIEMAVKRRQILDIPEELRATFFTNTELELIEDKEPTVLEYILSSALSISANCAQTITSGDLLLSFEMLTLANKVFGEAEGFKMGRDFTEKQSGMIKKKIQLKAEAIRHGENRAMRDQAIQYYKDNREMLGSKEKASYEISQKIVPVSSATVRGWLKNV